MIIAHFDDYRKPRLFPTMGELLRALLTPWRRSSREAFAWFLDGAFGAVVA